MKLARMLDKTYAIRSLIAIVISVPYGLFGL